MDEIIDYDGIKGSVDGNVEYALPVCESRIIFIGCSVILICCCPYLKLKFKTATQYNIWGVAILLLRLEFSGFHTVYIIAIICDVSKIRCLFLSSEYRFFSLGNNPYGFISHCVFFYLEFLIPSLSPLPSVLI